MGRSQIGQISSAAETSFGNVLASRFLTNFPQHDGIYLNVGITNLLNSA